MVYLPPDPASRTVSVAGKIAQCDLWLAPIELAVGFGQLRKPTQLPVLTMVLGYSRWRGRCCCPPGARRICSPAGGGMIEHLGAVPRVGVWDGEGAIGRRRGGRVELTDSVRRFAAPWAPRSWSADRRIRRPRGIIERAHDYRERSFLPGRTFASPMEFNTQLSDWLEVVNTRPRRVLGCAPG